MKEIRRFKRLYEVAQQEMRSYVGPYPCPDGRSSDEIWQDLLVALGIQERGA
jgi:hypothetical protein